MTLCQFLEDRGWCKYGHRCAYIHPSDMWDSATAQPKSRYRSIHNKLKISTLSKDDLRLKGHEISTFQELLDPNQNLNSSYRDLFGSRVQFDSSGKVLSVQLQSEFSAVYITGLRKDINKDSFSKILSEMAEIEIPKTSITYIGLVKDEMSALVQMGDSTIIQHLKDQLRALPSEHPWGAGVRMQPVGGPWQFQGVSKYTTMLSTVEISWAKRSKSADLVYSGREDYNRAVDAKAAIEKSRIRLRKVSASIIIKDNYDTTFLRLDNLDTAVTSREILALLPRHLRPTSCEFISSGHDCSNYEATDSVLQYLRGKGRLYIDNSIMYKFDVDSLLMVGNATFSNPQDAASAVTTLTIVTECNPPKSLKVEINHYPTIKYIAPQPILDAIRDEVMVYSSNLWPKIQFDFRVFNMKIPEGFQELRVRGRTVEALGIVKKYMERLLAGTVVKDKGSIFWHDGFQSATVLRCLAICSQRCGMHIVRDTSLCQLRIYGGTIRNHGFAQTYIIKQISIFSATKSIISWGVDHLTPMKAENPGECVVCYCKLEVPAQASCGHIYCQECLNDLVQHTDLAFMPFKCISNCEHIFTIEELKTLLPSAAIERFFRRCFQHWVAAHPQEYRYCSTPDCEQIYQPTAFVSNDFCNTCFKSYCTYCGVTPWHKDFSCEEYKELVYEGTRSIETWMAERDDVKLCPSCNKPVQKNAGCNHVQCGCGEHFCWVCREGFGKIELEEGMEENSSSFQTYDHLRLVHGGIGGGYVLQEDGVFVLDPRQG